MSLLRLFASLAPVHTFVCTLYSGDGRRSVVLRRGAFKWHFRVIILVYRTPRAIILPHQILRAGARVDAGFWLYLVKHTVNVAR